MCIRDRRYVKRKYTAFIKVCDFHGVVAVLIGRKIRKHIKTEPRGGSNRNVKSAEIHHCTGDSSAETQLETV